MTNPLIKAADTYFRARDTSPQALAAYSDLVKGNPRDARIRIQLQLLLQSVPWSPEAYRLLQAICTDDAPLQCLEQLLLWDLEAGDFVAADQHGRRILRSESDNQIAHRALAYLAERQGHFAEAQKSYSSALMWFDALRMAVASRDVQIGRQCVARLSDSDRHRSDTQVLVASLNALEGFVTEARAELKHVSTLTPRQKSALNLLTELDQVAKGQRNSTPASMPVDLPDGLWAGVTALMAFKAGDTLNSATLDQLMPETRPDFEELFLYAAIKQRGLVVDLLNGGAAFSHSAVRAAAFAGLRRWNAALSALPDTANRELAVQIRQGATQDKLRSSSSLEIAQLLADPTEREAISAAVPYLEYEAWKAGRIAEFATVALYDPALDMAGLHRIAVAAGRSAAQVGVPADRAERWAVAIAAWAAVLSDEAYWSAWVAQRGEVFGTGLSDEQAFRFRTDRLPKLIHKQGDALAEGLPSVEAAKVRRITATLSSAIEDAAAVRTLLRAADRKKSPVPAQIRALISPSLIQRADPDIIPALAALTGIEGLPRNVRDRVLHAVSPLAPVYALVDANQPEAALTQLRSLQPTVGSTAEYNELNDTVLRLAAQHFAEMERWTESFDAANELLLLRPKEVAAEELVVAAVMGLGNARLQKGEWQAAVDELKATRKSLSRTHSALDALLAEALVSIAVDKEPVKNPEAALSLVEEALHYDAQNQRGRLIAAMAYNARAFDKLEQKRYRDVLSDAKKAIELHDDPAPRRALVQALLGLKQWEEALNAVDKLTNEFFDEVNFDFWVRVRLDAGVGVYHQNDFDWAIRIFTHLLSLDYNSINYNIGQFNISAILSEVHTNYGVELAKQGSMWAAREQWQLALRYDPQNYTARNNMRISGRY